MSTSTHGSPWSERDLLLLYASLSMGTSIADIAAGLNRSVEEVAEKATSLKAQPDGFASEGRPTSTK
jgi:hypothetical protein